MDFRFEIPLDMAVERAWRDITDLSVLARCFPGARLDEATENGGRGTVVVSLGPIRFEYQGDVAFIATDDDQHKAVASITASDKGGGGGISARITLAVVPAPTGSASAKLKMDAEVDVSGRAAQFGRGMLEDVAQRLLADFAARLAAYGRGETFDEAGRGQGELNVLALLPKRAMIFAAAGAAVFGAGVLLGRLLPRRGTETT